MSKELEEFEEMYNWIYCNTGTTYEDDVKLDKIRKNVKSALQRLESIDNANPSEALDEIFNIIYNFDCGTTYEQDKKLNEYRETIKQALLKAQEQEKENAKLKSRIQNLEKDLEEQQELAKHYLEEQQRVLEIIKKKRIDIESFYKTFIEDDFNYLDYQIMYGTYGLELLTEEEFDLLKRWLG